MHICGNINGFQLLYYKISWNKNVIVKFIWTRRNKNVNLHVNITLLYFAKRKGAGFRKCVYTKHHSCISKLKFKANVVHESYAQSSQF